MCTCMVDGYIVVW